jgi:RimJ/RimL family protein N-acetyltransferase
LTRPPEDLRPLLAVSRSYPHDTYRHCPQVRASYRRCCPDSKFIIELRGEAVGLIQCYRHADHPDWARAVDITAAAGIDYLIGEANQRGRGVGSAAIASFTPRVFAWYSDVEVIVAAPQADNSASRRALEKAGFTLFEERQLDSDDPSDAGPSAIYALTRPS